MLDPTPENQRLRCPCCTNYFVAVEGFAEFCSEECAVTAMDYREFGELRRCKRCRSEFVAYEKHHRLCSTCHRTIERCA
jgi:hypothetical protein